MSSTASKLLTAEEFFQWVQLPANRGHRFELRAGEVIEMPPEGKYHGFVCGNLAGTLDNHGVKKLSRYA